MNNIFDFLKDEYRTIYLYCTSMEKLIQAKEFKLAVIAAKVISEEILNDLSKSPFNLKTTIPKLYKSQSYSLNNEKNKEIALNHLKIQKIAFKCVHNPDFKIEDISEIRETIFDILIEYYNNNQVPVFLKYNQSIDFIYSDNPTYPEYEFITKDELDNIFFKYNENFVYKKDLIKFIERQEQIISKSYVKTILKDFEEDINNKNELDTFFENKYEFLKLEEIKEIIEKYYDNIPAINDFEEEFTKNELIEIISSFNDNIISTDELYIDKYHHVLKEAIENILQSHLNNFLHEEIFGIYITDYVTELNLKLDRYMTFKNDTGYSFKETESGIVLNQYQKDAIRYNGEKPLVIDAGPGAGKTKVIIERVVYLIKKLNKKPNSILVITFTTKAADELKERFKTDTDLTTDVINQMRISTIHSFCRHILDSFDKAPKNYLDRHGEKGLFLQKHKKELGFIREAFLYNSQMPHAYNKYDEYNTFEVDADGLCEYIEENEPVRDEYLDYIDTFYLENPEWKLPPLDEIEDLGYGDDLYNARYLQIAESYPTYREIMDRDGVSDHELLLINTLNFLERNPHSSQNIKFRNILIDEFQDTDPIQMKIFEKLLEICETFTVVGDVDQSIYGFRGSYTTFFTNFANNSQYELIPLKFNYRSTKDIVEFNEALITEDREIPKELESTKPYKMPVYYMPNIDYDMQSKKIVKIIKHLKTNNKIDKYGDIAILYRSRNKYIYKIIEDLELAEIPFYLKDQNDLIEQDETKGILALFWYLTNDNSPYIRYYDEKTWLNLFAFTNTNYNSNEIFDLSINTMNIIKKLEIDYRNNVLEEEKNQKDGKQSANYLVLLKNKRNVLKKIFDKFEKPDLSTLTRDDLINLGITDEHDLNFFCKLNELKAKINDETLEVYKKPTSLEIFFELLNITGLNEKLLSKNNHDSIKALMNLGQISEIIDDYENIISKYDVHGMFDYLRRIIKTYSCPMNELEDNSNKVHIMTAHSSKGLEYPVVILSSLKNKSFPRVYNEQFLKQRYIFNRPNYYTPRDYLKYKPDTRDEEEKQYNQEEKRIMYVAATRAEELLILSSLPSKLTDLPDSVKNLTNYFKELDIENLDEIRKVKTKRKSKNEEITKIIEFEDILNDYLFCPLKYNLINNIKYRSIENNYKFIEKIISKVFNILHNPDLVINENDVDNILKTIEKSHDLTKSKDYKLIKELLEKIKKYWIKTGQHFDIIDYNFNISQNFNHIELTANIDLIIKEDDENISIVKFIISDENIKNYLNHYMNNLNYYGHLLERNREYKNYSIKNINLYCIKNNKMITNEYDENKPIFIEKILINTLENIDKQNFTRHKINCENCEFKDILCR